MIEVEVKARIESFDEMEEKLIKLGAIKTKIESQSDIYFQSPIVDFQKTDEALRVRITNNNAYITYKGPKLNSEAKTRKEIEIAIENPKGASDIFEELGFKKVRVVEKNRKYFKYDDFEISLDDVKGLKPYMEIEIALDDEKDYTDSQNRIFQLFEKLGVKDSFETTSYLELLENLNNR